MNAPVCSRVSLRIRLLCITLGGLLLLLAWSWRRPGATLQPQPEEMSAVINVTNDFGLILTQAPFTGRVRNLLLKESTNLWASDFGEASPGAYVLTNWCFLRLLQKGGSVLTAGAKNQPVELVRALKKLRLGETYEFPAVLTPVTNREKGTN